MHIAAISFESPSLLNGSTPFRRDLVPSNGHSEAADAMSFLCRDADYEWQTAITPAVRAGSLSEHADYASTWFSFNGWTNDV
jgi:hypothetical protein